jgi:chromate reductase
MNNISIGVILGSSRQTGWTRKVAEALSELTPRGVVLRRIDIADLPLYREELEEPSPPEQWLRFRAEVRTLDAALFVTPEHNRSVPAALKNAIDIGSSPDDHSVWERKPAAIVSHSPGRLGGFGANHHLRQSLVFLDMPVLQQPELYVSAVEKLFDANGRMHEGAMRERFSRFLEAFREWSERVTTRR